MTSWTVGSVAGIVVLIMSYFYSLRLEKRYEEVTFTPRKRDRHGEVVGHDVVDYEPRHGHYLKTAEVVVTLASASLLFIPSAHLNIVSLPKIGFSVVLLGWTVLFGILFMALLTFYYEEFLYMPRTFTIQRSAQLNALGLSELLCFGISYGWLAVQLARYSIK